MKTANIRIKINDLGHDIPKLGVTPAELQFLVASFLPAVQDVPVDLSKGFVETEDVERGEADEIERLCQHYNRTKVNAMFPSGGLPATWEDAIKNGRRLSQSSVGGMLQQSAPISVTTI